MQPRLPNLEKISPFVKEIDSNQHYSNGGPLVRKLESGYASIFNVSPEQVIAVSNATLAITIASLALDPKSWVVPDFTFPATALGVLNAGKKVYLQDVDIDSWALKTPNNIVSQDFGYVPVMPFGNNESLMNWKKVRNVVFDLAASIGDSELKLDWLNETQVAIFSLHATKISGCGEGGIVVCGSQDVALDIRSRINFGFSGNRITESMGLNGKMSEYSAAVALASLSERREELAFWREKNSLAYSESLLRKFENPNLRQNSVSPYWVIDFESNLANEFIEFARRHDVETRRWWSTQISNMPFASKLSSVAYGDNPNSRTLALAHVGLPMWKDIPFRAIEFICELIDSFRGI